jgi:putative DNA primase/helicase
MTTSQKNAQAQVLNTALDYWTAGFSVIPLKTDGSKSPAITSWKKYQTELPTKDELLSWFNKPSAIGIICGPVSGGLAVFDFECVEAWKFFEKRAQEEGLEEVLEQCPLVDTPGGGIHLYTCSPTPCGSGHKAHNPSMPSPKADSDLVAEVKAAGGYVMAHGSPANAHKAGKEYTVSRMAWLTDSKGPRPLPAGVLDKLLAILKELDKGPKQQAKTKPKATVQTEDKPQTAARFNGETTWEELLEADGWRKSKGPFNHPKYGADCFEWLRPGKDEGGCSATTSPQILWVFSSSTSLPINTAIDRFEYFALTQFGGDKHEAAKRLHAEWDKQDHSSPLGEADDDLPATTSEMAPFPVDCLPRVLAAFVKAHSVALTKDPVFVALPSLVVLAGAIGRSRRLEVDASGWVTQAVLWALLAVPPSSGKSVGLGKAAKPLEDLDEEWQVQNADKQAEYEKELAEWEAKENKEGETKPQPPKKRRLVVQDYTLESLVPIFKDNPSGLTLIEDELSTLMERVCRYNREGSVTDLMKFKNNSGRLINDRVGRSCSIDNPTMSIVGTIQPGALSEIFTDKLKRKGWPQRWFLAMPPDMVRQYGQKLPSIPPGINEAWAGLIKALALGRYGPDQDTVSILYRHSPESWEIWKSFANPWWKRAGLLNKKHRSDESERIHKAIEDTARLALILQTVEDLGPSDPWAKDSPQWFISGPVMQAAVTLGEWFFNEASRVHAIIEGVAHTDEMGVIIKAIQAHGGEAGLTARTIQKNHKARWKDAKEVLALLEQMEKKGVVKRVNKKPGSKGGAPAVFWLLNDD